MEAARIIPFCLSDMGLPRPILTVVGLGEIREMQAKLLWVLNYCEVCALLNEVDLS